MSFKLRMIKGKRGIAAETLITFIATILIIAILMIFILYSGAIKTFKNLSSNKDTTQVDKKVDPQYSVDELEIDDYMIFFKNNLRNKVGGIT